MPLNELKLFKKFTQDRKKNNARSVFPSAFSSINFFAVVPVSNQVARSGVHSLCTESRVNILAKLKGLSRIHHLVAVEKIAQCQNIRLSMLAKNFYKKVKDKNLPSTSPASQTPSLRENTLR